jgi:hypothetical protein
MGYYCDARAELGIHLNWLAGANTETLPKRIEKWLGTVGLVGCGPCADWRRGSEARS